ncbi:retrovirus-related pol polyprotein from transposon TNT 1-94 [Tanacetum coccineum]
MSSIGIYPLFFNQETSGSLCTLKSVPVSPCFSSLAFEDRFSCDFCTIQYLLYQPVSTYSTTVNQDAPSPSNSQTTPETQHPVIPNDVEEDNHDIEVAHMGNDPYFGIPIPKVPSDQYSSMNISHTIWIYKVKLDELGGILKNKARLVARGYRQEEGIDFEESFAPIARLRL